jgi:dihydrofolate reductase
MGRNMRKLIVFNNLSIDGRFVDRDGNMDWAREGNDEEFNAFSSENAKGGGTLLFGRVTYELMASFWPTRQAIEIFPVVAERMNSAPKVVFSRKMAKASWNNTMLVKGDIVAEVRKMKNEPGEGMVILGSGSIVSQLAPEGLVDEFQIVLNPVALGGGRSMFDGIEERLSLKLTRSRVFRNGKIFLCYEPIK